jgi:hypothetical protein
MAFGLHIAGCYHFATPEQAWQQTPASGSLRVALAVTVT